MDIYSIGEMVIDFIPGEEKGSYIRNAGGAPANVAIAAARNGLETGMCCKVGEDDFGKLLMFDVKNECLQYQVMCDKCLDVAGLTYKGINMNFLSKPGLQGRNHYDTNGQEALRSIMGGLFFTAGMDEKRPGAESIRHYERGYIWNTPIC